MTWLVFLFFIFDFLKNIKPMGAISAW